jgi:hypothetical protein
MCALPPACADDPPGDLESVKAFRKAAETAELHGVAVSHPAIYSFRHERVTDWPKLVEALRAPKGPVKHVWDSLPEGTQKMVLADGIVADLPARFPPGRVVELKGYVASAFNNLLGWTDFYQEEAFKGVVLADEFTRLVKLGKKRTAWQTAWLNWGLLHAAFPDAVPEIPTRFGTVRVEVRPGKDVALVLSCSDTCHWEVDVKPGGKVTGVILCGEGAQEVVVLDNPVEAPVVYRASYSPEGTPRDKPGDKYFNGYVPPRPIPGVKSDRRKKFEEGMKEITPKGFDSFQQGPKEEPYVIRPRDR